MVTKIKSISISQEDDELIEQYNLSPSALIKERLAQFRDADTYAAVKIRELNAKILRLIQNFQKAIDFINENGLGDKFLGIENVVQEERVN